jgi:LPXTG-motif cell wall-anchored protein
LANTGIQVFGGLSLALVLLVGGSGLLLGSRRRRSH